MSAPLSQPRRRPQWTTLALIALLLLGVVLTVLFGLRATRSFRDFRDHRGRPPMEATGDLEAWMTLPYIAKAYAVPEEYLFEKLGIAQENNRRKSLMQLNRTHYPAQRGVILDLVRAALESYYAGAPVPTPIVPNPGDVPLPELPPPGRDDGPPRDPPQPELPPDAEAAS